MVVVLIPSYKPDEKLLTLLQALHAQGKYAGLVVVDDGGGETYAPIFARAEEIPGVSVVRHAVNQGKGRALKTGINATMLLYPEADIVTADADGQHTPEDIARIADALEEADGATIILGKRVFGKGTPIKSFLGNTITRWVFALSTGTRVYDTQTGLRGLPSALLPDMLRIPGDRYEYEMNVLLQAPREGAAFREVEIQTVYENNNAGSHFHPFRDAMLVFTRILFFAASSLICFGVDYGAYAVLLEIRGLPPEFAYVGARILSSLLNFVLNRNLVFRAHKGSMWKQFLGYYALVIVIMVLGSLGVQLGTDLLDWNNYLVKILVDLLLSIVSFMGQRLMVFKPARHRALKRASDKQ
ncbi:MAG: GtrA family protein [Candidatus Spyradocola sp.]